jgi:hypothetical protein
MKKVIMLVSVLIMMISAEVVNVPIPDEFGDPTGLTIKMVTTSDVSYSQNSDAIYNGAILPVDYPYSLGVSSLDFMYELKTVVRVKYDNGSIKEHTGQMKNINSTMTVILDNPIENIYGNKILKVNVAYAPGNLLNIIKSKTYIFNTSELIKPKD